MTVAILDDRALGGSLRVAVTLPRALDAAKTAVDGVIAAIDAAASRFAPTASSAASTAPLTRSSR